jgi:hypothetical protein
MKTENERIYESYDDNWRRLYFNNDSQGFVVAHKKHGKEELPSNRAVGIRLAKYFGEKIELLPQLFGEHLKSADANRNDEIWEWKTTNGSYTSVQKRLRVGSHQCGRILLVLPETFENSDVLRGIISAVNSDKNKRIIQITLFLPNNKLVDLTRDMVGKRDFTDFYVALDA